MARPGLTRHRKFLRLAQVLQGRALAFGSLGLIWEVAYENGDPLIGDELSVEAAADWRGQPGQLCRALVECGFLSATDAGYVVHDFWTHAPAYVRKRRKRELERHAAGQVLAGDQSVTSHRRTIDHELRPNGSTPCSQHPAPSTTEPPNPLAPARGNRRPRARSMSEDQLLAEIEAIQQRHYPGPVTGGDVARIDTLRSALRAAREVTCGR